MRQQILITAFASALLLWACGDDEVTPTSDTTTPADTATTDTATTDTAVADTAVADTAVADTAVADTAVADTTVADTTVADTTPTDTMADVGDTVLPTGTLAEVVTAALLLANGATLTVNQGFEGLTVTVLKPTHGTEPGGFFLQDGAAGAAIHVQVADPAPAEVAALAPSDVISIQIGTVTMVSGVPMVTAFSGVVETGTEAGLATWPRDLDALASADAFAPHLNALVTISGTLTSGAQAAGGGTFGFRRFAVATTGLPAGDDARVALRFPVALIDALGLEQGCEVEILRGAVWGFRTNTAGAATDYQPSAYHSGDVTAVCPAPVPVSAVANDNDMVTVTFSRPLDPATVVAGAFTITPTLAVNMATLSADGRSVTLETAPQAANTTYTIAVATSVEDVLGEPVPASSTVEFQGATPALPIGAVWCFDDSTLNPTAQPGVTGATFTWSIGGGTFPQGNRTVGLIPPAGCATDTSQAASNNTWAQTATPDFATGPYFEVSFTTAAAGTVVIEFDGHRSSTGPSFLQPHHNGAALGSVMDTPTSFSSAHPMFATSQVSVAAGAHAFRFYGYGATATSGTFRIDNLVVRFAPN